MATSKEASLPLSLKDPRQWVEHFKFNNLDYDFEAWHKRTTNEIALNAAKIKAAAHSDSTNIDCFGMHRFCV
ncbi:MAG: hypothetical protein B7Y25_02155 [Alphaproteobacteria bacterium 16-39-46]|nr:MAG: hypothetical protein B7Y25_02155 [Alphaproteobacteria bacterium 16-39-46]OZA43708.1 MAG: hypothetical protein B7X84_02405 [Alphaproteobacteria bacterium 17-39-52]HQS83640.1 hypothetical protein [Alphaproteobacteria bacterium]HQS93567.1 hypothetical protein [Alphaproteobacteria bacterium]